MPLNFMDYLNHKKNIPFEICIYQRRESDRLWENESHRVAADFPRRLCAVVQELEIGKIVILSEGVHPPDLDRYPSVYKYQASSDVVREVMACWSARAVVSGCFSCTRKKTTKL